MPTSKDTTTVDAFMRIHLRVNLEGLLLRMDSSTMAASVEGRVPFTDHRLVEHLYQLPCAMRMALKQELISPASCALVASPAVLPPWNCGL